MLPSRCAAVPVMGVAVAALLLGSISGGYWLELTSRGLTAGNGV